MPDFGDVVAQSEFVDLGSPSFFGFRNEQLIVYQDGFEVRRHREQISISYSRIESYDVEVNEMFHEVSGSFKLASKSPIGLTTRLTLQLTDPDDDLVLSFFQSPATKWGMNVGFPEVDPTIEQLISLCRLHQHSTAN